MSAAQGDTRICTSCGRGLVFLGTVWLHRASNNKSCNPTDLRLRAMLNRRPSTTREEN